MWFVQFILLALVSTLFFYGSVQTIVFGSIKFLSLRLNLFFGITSQVTAVGTYFEF